MYWRINVDIIYLRYNKGLNFRAHLITSGPFSRKKGHYGLLFTEKKVDVANELLNFLFNSNKKTESYDNYEDRVLPTDNNRILPTTKRREEDIINVKID